jgi:hypothetical protein
MQTGDGEGHSYYEDLAVAHVVGGLDESDGRIFRAHLLDCADCRARVWELRAIAHELADVERDERRERAAQALDTKQREDGEGGEESDTDAGRPSGRVHRIVFVLALGVLMALATWNFALRGTIARQGDVIAGLEAASAALAFGQQGGSVLRTGEGVQGSLRVHQGQIVIVVEGLQTGDRYGLYLLDDSGAVLNSRSETATNGMLFLTVRQEPDTERVVVTELPNGAPSLPTGARVFEAAVAAP